MYFQNFQYIPFQPQLKSFSHYYYKQHDLYQRGTFSLQSNQRQWKHFNTIVSEMSSDSFAYDKHYKIKQSFFGNSDDNISNFIDIIKKLCDKLSSFLCQF
jgi:hypothetical protein